jgi:hypothetical protein
MQQLEDQEGISDQESLAPVASYGHTFGLLAILCAVFAISFALQHGPAYVNNGVAQVAQGQPHRRIIPGLIESIIFDWAVL